MKRASHARRIRHLGELNEAQRQVVAFGVADSNVHPPLLVIAGAGSGKTNTLAHRVARLVGDGSDPSASCC